MEATVYCWYVPMDEWDAYQEQLKKFGIEDAIAMMQTAYDNYMAN